jgi:hypothetical protein
MTNEELYASISVELIAGHPVTGAYDADDIVALSELKAVNIVRDRPTVPAAEILEQIIANPSEWNALTSGEQTMISMILDLNKSVPTDAASPARVALIAILGASTVAAVGAIIPETVSQSVALWTRDIQLGDVQNGRAV